MTDETWFEVKIDTDLAVVLSKICRAYAHRGKVQREAFLQRLQDAIPTPSGEDVAP
jgi:hypothetical protein